MCVGSVKTANVGYKHKDVRGKDKGRGLLRDTDIVVLVQHKKT